MALWYHKTRQSYHPNADRGATIGFSNRCQWGDGCRKWSVPGAAAFCRQHLKFSQEMEKMAMLDAIAIEKLEAKVQAGDATERELIQRQRKSVADSAEQRQSFADTEQRQSLMQIALEEEATIAEEEQDNANVLFQISCS